MTMNEAYYYDCEIIEQGLYFEKRASGIMEHLDEGRAFTLTGLIEECDVVGWRNKLFAQYDARECGNMRQPVYITEKHIYDYIEACADKCIEYMSKKETICRLGHT